MNDSFSDKLVDLAGLAYEFVYYRNCPAKVAAGVARLTQELKDELDRLDTLPSDIFAPLKKQNRVKFDHLFEDPFKTDYCTLRASPELFIHMMKKFPGQFESAVGHMYLAVPELVKAAIDSGEPISLYIYEKNYEGRTLYCGPACHVSLKRLDDAKICSIGESEEDLPTTGYYEEIEAFKQCVTMLNAAGSHVNDRDDDMNTLLLQVLYIEDSRVHRDVIPFLIGLGASPDLSSRTDGMTPLHWAMQYYGKEIGLGALKALLDCPYPLDLNVFDLSFLSPLDNCLTEKDLTLEAIRVYLDRDRKQSIEFGVDSNLLTTGRGYNNQTILYLLAEKGDHAHIEELSDMLIAYGANPAWHINLPGKPELITNAEGYAAFKVGPRMIDEIIENKAGKFSERVVAYYQKKKFELGL